ncbi:hypothetical protein D9M69_711060 [compost metagenome]
MVFCSSSIAMSIQKFMVSITISFGRLVRRSSTVRCTCGARLPNIRYSQFWYASGMIGSKSPSTFSSVTSVSRLFMSLK